MKKIYIRILIFLLIAAALVVGGIARFPQKIQPRIDKPAVVQPALAPQGEMVSGTIVAGGKSIRFSARHNETLYDALMGVKASGSMDFDGKLYPGLGFFVTQVGTLSQGEGKNLMYFINGKEASVGVSSYTLKNGDVIEWKLQ